MTEFPAEARYLSSFFIPAGETCPGFVLRASMALALTQRRLMTLTVGAPLGLGIGGKVSGLLRAVPIDAVDEIVVKQAFERARAVRA